MRRTFQALLAGSALALLLLPGLAQAANPGSLDGETLLSPVNGSHTTATTGCNGSFFTGPLPGTVTYSATRLAENVATGPYPGTFTETGTLTFDATGGFTLSADFQIYNSAGALVVSGHKTGSGAGGCTFGFSATGIVSYTATTPAGPDSGTSTFDYSGVKGPNQEFGNDPLTETFTSTAAPRAPTRKQDCKSGGFQNYGGMFNNQGQCIKYVKEHSG